MNRHQFLILSFLLILLGTGSSHAQFWKRKKETIKQKNEIDTPRKRRKLRFTDEKEAKVKTKKNNKFMSKKSKSLEYKVNVSRKSNETSAVIDENKTLKNRTDRLTRKLKRAKNKSEKMSTSQGRVRDKPMGTYKESATDEKVTQKVKRKSLRKQKKEREHVEDKIAGSHGPVTIKEESYRKEPGTVYREDKKGGSKYKSQAERGAFTVKGTSPLKRKREIAEKSQKASAYKGEITLARNKKDLHPSASYLESRRIRSIESKEKLRKRELKKSRGRNSGQPTVVTRKKKKLKYDTRESEIWNE